MDLFHAREHLHELAAALEFMLGGQHDQWLAARLEDLGYFENNAPRMRYHWFRSRACSWARPGGSRV